MVFFRELAGVLDFVGVAVKEALAAEREKDGELSALVAIDEKPDVMINSITDLVIEAQPQRVACRWHSNFK